MTFICKSNHFSKTEKGKKKLRTKLGNSDHTYIVVSGNSGIPHVLEKNIIFADLSKEALFNNLPSRKVSILKSLKITYFKTCDFQKLQQNKNEDRWCYFSFIPDNFISMWSYKW